MINFYGMKTIKLELLPKKKKKSDFKAKCGISVEVYNSPSLLFLFRGANNPFISDVEIGAYL